MIQSQTILKVVDNSGAKTARCFKILNGFKKKYATIGDTIIVSVQKLRNRYKKNSKVKSGEIYRALIIRTKIGYTQKDGSRTMLNENSIVLLNKQDNPLGTRILGPLPNFLNKKKFQKFVSISHGIV